MQHSRYELIKISLTIIEAALSSQTVLFTSHSNTLNYPLLKLPVFLLTLQGNKQEAVTDLPFPKIPVCHQNSPLFYLFATLSFCGQNSLFMKYIMPFWSNLMLATPMFSEAFESKANPAASEVKANFLMSGPERTH